MLERDFINPGRSSAISENGMIATSHPLATMAGLEILKVGGNAIDAAISAVAVQCVVEPASTGIGGDCFALISRSNKNIIQAYNGSGYSPAALSPEVFSKEGLTQIPETSPHAVTIPGAIDMWCQLHEEHGKLDLLQILGPAIDAGEKGYRVTPRVGYDWERNTSRVNIHEATKKQFLPNNSAPKTGDIMANPALAGTLKRIANEGRKAFYEGSVASEITEVLNKLGGVHTNDDFAEFRGFETEPISAPYRGYSVYECPPNGQGLAALIILRILDGFDLCDGNLSESDRIHLLAEATKAAYRQRDILIADPDHSRYEIEHILNDSFINGLRKPINLKSVTDVPIWNEAVHKDTVYLTVVDQDRNSVSFINSIFMPFGSGIYAPKSGVLLQNRGCGFSLAKGHPNEVGARKRPLHTIIPGMLVSGGKVVMPFGVMGGQFQATGHAHFLSHVVDRDYNLQRANEAPRSFCYGGELLLEHPFGEDVRKDLEQRGHRVSWSQEPIGGCQAIYIDDSRGFLMGGSDHRKDGLALGY